MKPYTLFPTVYDYLLKHVDYERWYTYIRSIMITYIDRPKSIIELGCGTGKFGAKFSRDGFEIYGMDISFEMLEVAKIRAYKNYRIFCADMRDFRLAGKFDYIFSVHDTMNYFLDYADLSKVLKSIKNIMHKNSIFMFDITTEYNIKKYFDNNRTEYLFKDIKIVWENDYNPKSKLISSTLNFSSKKLNGIEKHIQRIYSIDEIRKLLVKEGFKILDILSDYSYDPVKDNSVMINFITKLKD